MPGSTGPIMHACMMNKKSTSQSIHASFHPTLLILKQAGLRMQASLLGCLARGRTRSCTPLIHAPPCCCKGWGFLSTRGSSCDCSALLRASGCARCSLRGLNEHHEPSTAALLPLPRALQGFYCSRRPHWPINARPCQIGCTGAFTSQSGMQARRAVLVA